MASPVIKIFADLTEKVVEGFKELKESRVIDLVSLSIKYLTESFISFGAHLKNTFSAVGSGSIVKVISAAIAVIAAGVKAFFSFFKKAGVVGANTLRKAIAIIVKLFKEIDWKKDVFGLLESSFSIIVKNIVRLFYGMQLNIIKVLEDTVKHVNKLLSALSKAPDWLFPSVGTIDVSFEGYKKTISENIANIDKDIEGMYDKFKDNRIVQAVDTMVQAGKDWWKGIKDVSSQVFKQLIADFDEVAETFYGLNKTLEDTASNPSKCLRPASSDAIALPLPTLGFNKLTKYSW